MTLGVTLELNQAFFTGAPSSIDIPGLVPVAIGGHGYLIEPSLFERQTIERFRNPYDQSEEPGEHSLSTKGPWLRSTAAWGHGAGQDFWDQPKSDRERFRASKGLDIWTDQHRVQLIHATREIRSSAGTNLRVLAVGAYLYIVDGQQVYHTNAPTDEVPTFTSSTIHIAAGAVGVNDFTTDGGFVYAAVGANGINKTALGAAVSTHLSATQADLIQYANGRLLAAAGPDLSEIDAAGAATPIKEHDSTGFVWSTIAAAPNGIYAAGNIGDRAEVYYIGTTDVGALDVPLFAMPVPDGETVNVLRFYNNVMLIGTSVGIRLGTIGANNGIEYGTAIKIPGGVTAFEPQAEWVWFNWTNYDGTSTGLGRFSLAALVDNLVPAYASDLMADTQGSVTSVATFGTRRYFAVSGEGFYAEFADYVDEGTLYTGGINFSTGERKVALSLDMRHQPLVGTITTSIISEDETMTTIGSSSIQGSLSPPDPLSIGQVTSETFELVFTLSSAIIGEGLSDRLLESGDTRLLEDLTERDLESEGEGAALAGPVLRRWTFRALVTPIRYDEILCPIIMTETVNVPDEADGHEYALTPSREWAYLKQLEASGVPTIFQLGTRSETVYVEQVGLPPHQDRKWTPDRSFLQGIVTVRMVTI